MFFVSPVKLFKSRGKSEKSVRETDEIARGKLGFQILPVKNMKLPVANLAKSCPWNFKIARETLGIFASEIFFCPLQNQVFLYEFTY